MARGLQELIDFLLNEVALCGSQGATVLQVLTCIDTFYQSSKDNDSRRCQNVDHRFQSKVWSWLTRNPEVSVGENNKLNHLTFDQVKSLETTGGQDETPNTEANESTENEPTSYAPSDVRIYVSRERTWYAVAGHEPDENKLPASEFALLSIIATRKSSGISQVELIRLSGQDKRSVPKRTDTLATKGHIEKRAIHVKGARTSLLIHRLFLNTSTSENPTQQTTENNRMIDFHDFTTRLFDIIRSSQNGLIGRKDLKEALGFTELWYSRILSRAIRKWEQIGVLRRVRAESQYKSMHSCVELLREPTQQDFDCFFEFSNSGINKDGEDLADPDDEMELEPEEKEENANGGTATFQGRGVVHSGRIIPSWTPDRNTSNQIFDIIDKSGTTGITNDMINRVCFGRYYKRPSESLTHRLTDCWQVSQPPHLRHLALVRDSGVRKTIIHYVHYSARNFAKKVEQGDAFWEAVEFPVKNNKSKVKIPPVHASFQVDENGFASNDVRRSLMKDGNVSLFEGISSCKPPNYSLTRKDPTGVYGADGSYRIQAGNTVALENLPPREGSSRKLGRPKKNAQISSTSNGVKRETSASPEINEVSMAMDTTPRRLNRSQAKHGKYRGMSKKERFEAMGWDMTWTEYSALVMEKPTPGIYVTPHGKRRPAGKKQGRPKQSRIAVFKSSRLSSLSWFTRADEDSDAEMPNEAILQPPTVRVEESTPAPLVSVAPSSPIENAESTPTKERSGKRAKPSTDSHSLDTAPGNADRSEHLNERSTKRRRVSRTENEPDGTIQAAPGPNTTAEPSGGVAADNAISSDAQGSIPPRETTNNEDTQIQTPARSQNNGLEAISTGAQMQPASHQSMRPSQAGTPNPSRTPVTKTSKVSNESARKHGSSDRGGSIPFIRRKIILEIVDKAGGAYPSGIELWYAFATAWMNSMRKEKPDTRTVSTAVKYLVDDGKLHQFTFSKKNLKGVLVTKTILRKPEISPDAPVIKKIQEEFMIPDRDPRKSFSPHVKTSQILSKYGHRPSRFGPPKPGLPTVSASTVHLHSKPRFVRAQEQRQERLIQKELFRRLTLNEYSDDDDDDEDDDELHQKSRAQEDTGNKNQGTRRLMRIPLPSTQATEAKTHISRPKLKKSDAKTQEKKSPRPPKIRKSAGRTRMLPSISTIDAMSMMMNPSQVFHPVTGTFATSFSKSRSYRGKARHSADTRSHVNDGDPVRELTAIARKPDEQVNSTAKGSAYDQRFSQANELIMRWELEHQAMLDSVLEGPTFIEQTVPENFHAEPIEGSIRFDIDEPEVPTPVKKSPMRTRRMDRPRPSKRQRVPNEDAEGKQMEQRTRRRTNLRPLPEGVIRRYMVAIVAVRTLTGGLDGKIVDWELVPLAFPKSEPEVVIQYGKSILSRNRMEIHKMQHDFQERYLRAYERDQVPPIDYGNLRGYNWPALVEWASVELEFSTSEKAPTLPATREQFDGMFELREDPVYTAEELHATSGNITVINRRRLMGRMPFVVEQSRQPPRTQRPDLVELEIVKTWVRANVTTPEDRYNAAAAAQTLKPFGDTLLSAATQSLVVDRIICATNRGRVIPGRNYMMHDVFHQVLERRRGIEGDQLIRAAEFKTVVLDPALKKDGVFHVSYHASDGDALAIEELFANDYIDIIARDPPKDKFGLMDGGYLTRQMDRSRLRFEMEVRPRPSYKYGNPILDKVNLTPAPLPTSDGHMPLWFDINGCLIQDLWKKTVAVVLGCIILRPGVSVDGIAAMCRPSLMKWEIELLLEQWLLKVGAVQKSENVPANWSLAEWWWLVLGQ